MKETNWYWVFDGGNMYSKFRYAQQEAEKAFETLTNCINCRGCTDCINFNSQPEMHSTLRIGSRSDITCFYLYEGKIYVRCGCFYGILGEFEKAVEKRHGDNEHGERYKLEIENVKKLWGIKTAK